VQLTPGWRCITLRTHSLRSSSIVTSDAIAKLLIKKGIITEKELTQALGEERVNYQAMVENIKVAVNRLEHKDH
jgi:hypothetical protein